MRFAGHYIAAALIIAGLVGCGADITSHSNMSSPEQELVAKSKTYFSEDSRITSIRTELGTYRSLKENYNVETVGLSQQPDTKVKAVIATGRINVPLIDNDVSRTFFSRVILIFSETNEYVGVTATP